MTSKTKLKRTLGLPLVTLYGLGNILGAGIYVLVGKVAGTAGSGTTLAFILAMITASFTAFSYMELASRYPVSASISVYLHSAFKKRWLSVTSGLLMAAGGIASAAALARGFAGYLNSFIDVPVALASVMILCILGLIALKGITESAKTAAVLTTLEALGLVLIIWYGKGALSEASIERLFVIDPQSGIGGIMAGAFLAFYAFIGFEDMVNVAEETKNPKRTMPIAILLSLAIATVLYLLVVVVSVTLVPPKELADSTAPLTLVFERSGASHAGILSAIGMVAAINGIIVQIVMGSRILYGLSNQGWIDRRLSTVHKRHKTPVIATLCILALMIVGTIALPLVSLAQITSLLVLSIFTMVNLSLIVIKRNSPAGQGSKIVRVPLVVPFVGALLCVCAIVYQLVNWF